MSHVIQDVFYNIIVTSKRQSNMYASLISLLKSTGIITKIIVTSLYESKFEMPNTA